MKRLAFTMLELLIVIVVLGILATLAIPRMERDVRQEAKDNILSALRYTQHLALVDNKTNLRRQLLTHADGTTSLRDLDWQQTLWTMGFSRYFNSNNKYFYTISSNTNYGLAVDKHETAMDPANGKYMYHLPIDSEIRVDESPNIFIGKKYGVNSVVFSGGCGPEKYIAFDYLGRPFKSGIFTAVTPYAGYMTSNCYITVGFEESSAAEIVFTIEKETGFVSAS